MCSGYAAPPISSGECKAHASKSHIEALKWWTYSVRTRLLNVFVIKIQVQNKARGLQGNILEKMVKEKFMVRNGGGGFGVFRSAAVDFDFV